MTQIASRTSASMGTARKVFLLYLAVLSLAGGLIVYRAASRQGPGVSTDATMMMSSAENLLKGSGLVNFQGMPLTQFPPLESMLLALGSLISGQDVFTVGWALCVLVFPLIIWFCGLYFYSAFHEEPILAYFASFIIFSSTSLVEISANIASDPLFLLLVVLFLMCVSAYLKNGSPRYWVLSILLANLACFERYVGLTLVIVGALITAYQQRANLRKAALASAAFALAAGGPIFAWGYLHNVPVIGEPFGLRQPTIPPLNFLSAVEKTLYWFIPFQVISLARAIVLMAVIVCALLLVLLLTRTLTAARYLQAPSVAPSALFLPIYFAVLVFHLSYSETRAVTADRVHVILLPALLLVLFTLCRDLVAAARLKLGPYPFYGIAIVLFLAWSLYPLGKTYKYVNQSLLKGDVSDYNSVNSGNVRTSPLAQYLLSMDYQHSRLYSNGGGKAWFILHEQVASPPLTSSEGRLGYLKAHFAGWPGAGEPAYLIWFNRESYTPLEATPEELQAIADLQVVYSDKDGTVYKIAVR